MKLYIYEKYKLYEALLSFLPLHMDIDGHSVMLCSYAMFLCYVLYNDVFSDIVITSD